MAKPTEQPGIQPVLGIDAYSPREVAERVESAGVAKAHLSLLPMALLGMLAGGFIALGCVGYVLVVSDASLGFAASRVLGGLMFSLGLLLVVVAGAELFTGNNLLVMAYADGRIGAAQVLRNWVVVCLANAVGAAAVAWLVHASGHLQLHDGRVGAQLVALATAKSELPALEAFARGVLCNLLVCMAVWMSQAARSVADKAVAVVPPVVAFVAAGFEHSIANLYFFPLAWLHGAPGLSLGGVAHNLGFVVAGNLVGGSVLVGLIYHLIYRRRPAP